MDKNAVNIFLGLNVLQLNPNDDLLSSSGVDSFMRSNTIVFWNKDRWQAFNPVDRIDHAWLMEDVIAKESEKTITQYTRYLCPFPEQLTENSDGWEALLKEVFMILHASPEQRSIAAVKTYGTPQQIKELLG